jgi:hypothetical protein
MKYLVIELQSTGDSVSNIVTTHDTINQAESKFHQILTSAAVSSVPVHSAVVMTDEGHVMKHECYKHITE